MEYIVNPQTGRKIKVGGPTYMKIKDRYNWDFVTPLSKKPEPTQVAPKRRGSVTRGWAEDAPKRGYPRLILTPCEGGGLGGTVGSTEKLIGGEPYDWGDSNGGISTQFHKRLIQWQKR